VHVRFGGRASESAGSNATRRRCSTLPYIRLRSEFVYLGVVLDAYSRRVVGWALGRTLQAELALTALRMAVAERQPAAGLVHHSDRGVQYACDRDICQYSAFASGTNSTALEPYYLAGAACVATGFTLTEGTCPERRASATSSLISVKSRCISLQPYQSA